MVIQILSEYCMQVAKFQSETVLEKAFSKSVHGSQNKDLAL